MPFASPLSGFGRAAAPTRRTGWDMGHLPGWKVRKHQVSAADRGISRAEFLDAHNAWHRYRPELPEAGLCTYATIGLSQFDNGLTSESGNRIGIELLVTGREENTFLASGLANAALNIASGGYQAKPGIVFPGIFDGYGPDIATPHGLLWYPFAWDTHFDGLSRDGVDVEWLLDAGVEKLIDTFESDAVDIYDTGRSSAV
ncbi:GH-E family nuclease [Microbacterium testaceum]|uniref:Toxin YqcG C-terminal domain-containing protein n=1 Tax=Microbacterium testaceum TaxID=2033 RepID=A0A2T7WWF0_MICTE|nr:GH-E family nuclease [Microbacterium testaceum]PVE78958.1 hypothetical protein DC432_02805 [Microbacterium testaceum]